MRGAFFVYESQPHVECCHPKEKTDSFTKEGKDMSTAPPAPAGQPACGAKVSKSIFEILREVIVHIVVAALVGIATYAWATLHAKQVIEEAPTVYVQELDKLINTAVDEGEDNAILNAKAIVAARNSLAGSLTGLGKQLDGQIDGLAKMIGSDTLGVPDSLHEGSPRNPENSAPFSNREVYMQIRVLKKIWPAKKRQIEIEIRKLFAELGLYGKSKYESSRRSDD
jgi:hypothetical protein